MNGFLTFAWSTGDSTPNAFPAGSNYVAVYFSNVGDICGSASLTGDVYYRLENGKYGQVFINLH
jgi:hypothetical protein